MTGRRCALITLDEDVEEIEELARSAGYEVSFIVLQRRSRPDPVTFVGRGKLEEIADVLKAVRIDALILNGDLKPSQHYLLENTLKVECIDRIRLVLDIFTLRANNKESRLQVERARLRYEVPLLREWIHSAKAGEHPGFLGSGEYAVDVYYDLTKTRMKRIDDELESMRSSERQRREQRKRRGLNLVSFAGYTNAGKSSMMRGLTGEEVLVQDMMFSTLSTTTKRLRGSTSPVLITDTIGFLDDLPPYVIEAFKNTIEEIFSADLVVVVLDCSEPLGEMDRKLRTSELILFPEVEPSNIIYALNKVDRLEEGGREEVMGFMNFRCPGRELYLTSARTGEGLERLRASILRRFAFEELFEIVLPQTGTTESFLTRLRGRADIFRIEHSEVVRVRGACRGSDMKPLSMEVESLRGTIRFIEPHEPYGERP